MDGMNKAFGIVYTPHQCWYSDRKYPYWEKTWNVSEGTSGTLVSIPNTSLLMALTIFNPLNRTWAISRPPRSQKGYFGLKQPFCQGEDYFAYFEFAKNPTKSGKCLKPKVIPSFLGDVGHIKVVSEFSFGHPKCHFGHVKMGTFYKSAHIQVQKTTLWVPQWKFWDNFYKPNIPQKLWNCLWF